MPAHSNKTIGVVISLAGALLVLRAILSMVVWAMTLVDLSDHEFDSTNGIMISIVPINILGGVVLVVAGFQIARGSHTARRCAQICVGGLYLTTLVFIAMTHDVGFVGSPLDALPKNWQPLLLWVNSLGQFVFASGLSAILLFLLQPPRSSS